MPTPVQLATFGSNTAFFQFGKGTGTNVDPYGLQAFSGLTVDPTAPGTTAAGNDRQIALDLSGAILANIRNLTLLRDRVQASPPIESAVATVTITSTSTTWVYSSAIDCSGYNEISFLPIVTTAGGTVGNSGNYRLVWSHDAATSGNAPTNGINETVNTYATASGGEQVISQNINVYSFTSNTTGEKSSSPFSGEKRGRYLFIGQRSDSAITITANYRYQLY
ncbi:hypothetical protein H6F86_20440 [Phormidium sp. FACHB-592]|uniref:Uncharacterized protein n=1 Tax=Stenomitos frigidus AS-A4 TaxID=2933935 RepID=A0ABV0KEE7_9CYAN|nr:hypothetical protein [Phormidium sp. FACHB-592]MBD2076201.1 hypothetical protein [Phormidium sp. FACHB-592]